METSEQKPELREFVEGDRLIKTELSDAEVQKFKMLAAQITSDSHFQAILQTVLHDQRRSLYMQIKPYLAFKAKPFFLYRFN